MHPAFMKRFADSEPGAFRAVVAIDRGKSPDTLEFHRAASLGLADYRATSGYSLTVRGRKLADYAGSTMKEVQHVQGS